MATVEVKFLCDSTKAVIPCNFIKDFEERPPSKDERRYAFWSPDDTETPASLREKLGSIPVVDEQVKSKLLRQPQAGYYRAVIIKINNSELENEAESTTRVKKRKLLDEDAIESSKKSVLENGIKKEILDEDDESNEADMATPPPSNENSISESDHDADSSGELKHQMQRLKTKYTSLKKKYTSAKEEIGKLLSYNLKLQDMLFKKYPDQVTTDDKGRTEIKRVPSPLDNEINPVQVVSSVYDIPETPPARNSVPAGTYAFVDVSDRCSDLVPASKVSPSAAKKFTDTLFDVNTLAEFLIQEHISEAEVEILKNECITGQTLVDLTDADLKELNLKMGTRKRIQQLLREEKERKESPKTTDLSSAPVKPPAPLRPHASNRTVCAKRRESIPPSVSEPAPRASSKPPHHDPVLHPSNKPSELVPYASNKPPPSGQSYQATPPSRVDPSSCTQLVPYGSGSNALTVSETILDVDPDPGNWITPDLVEISRSAPANNAVSSHPRLSYGDENKDLNWRNQEIWDPGVPGSSMGLLGMNQPSYNESQDINFAIDIRGWLESDPRGPEVIPAFDAGTYSSSDRTLLVRVVVRKMMNLCGTAYPSSQIKEEVAKSIITTFPALQSQSMSSGHLVFYDPETKQGFLEYRLKTVRKSLSICKNRRSPRSPRSKAVLQPTSTERTVPFEAELILSSEDLELRVQSMQSQVADEHNKDDITMTLDETRWNRQLEIRKGDSSLDQLLQRYPRLKDYDGEMIEREYFILNPGKDNFPYQFGCVYAPRILQYVRKHRMDLVGLVENFDDNLKALFLLVEILPCPNAGKRKGREGPVQKNPYKKKVVPNPSLMRVVSSDEDLLGLPDPEGANPGQPFLVMTSGGFEASFVLRAGSALIPVGGEPLRAFDVLRKFHHVFHVEYATELLKFFNFINGCILQMQPPIPSCDALNTSLLNMNL